MHGNTTAAVTTKQYISRKATVLKDFGLSNKDKVKAHLNRAIIGIDDPNKREIRIDRVAHDMIMQFLDGSREFC